MGSSSRSSLREERGCSCRRCGSIKLIAPPAVVCGCFIPRASRGAAAAASSTQQRQETAARDASGDINRRFSVWAWRGQPQLGRVRKRVRACIQRGPAVRLTMPATRGLWLQVMLQCRHCPRSYRLWAWIGPGNKNRLALGPSPRCCSGAAQLLCKAPGARRRIAEVQQPAIRLSVRGRVKSHGPPWRPEYRADVPMSTRRIRTRTGDAAAVWMAARGPARGPARGQAGAGYATKAPITSSSDRIPCASRWAARLKLPMGDGACG